MSINNHYLNFPKMPSLFIAHGSPMNAINNNYYTQAISKFSSSLVKPKGIIMISAHWITQNKTLIQVSEQLKTIHDFSGFPQELYAISYQPKGLPELSFKIHDLIKHINSVNSLPIFHNNLDHGAWSILKHMFPDADIPVVQISIDYNLTNNKHFEIGQRISELSNDGYLIIGSGNLIHNLLRAERLNISTSSSQHWSTSLSKELEDYIYKNEYQKLIDFKSIKYSNIGINTADHYLPFLYSLGAGQPHIPQPIYKGFELGTLDMHSIYWS